MAYHPLKKFKRKELNDELDMLIAEQLNLVVRGELSSEEAREAFTRVIDGRFRRRAKLKHRKLFQRSLLLTVLGGFPDPAEDDLELALSYLRRRVLKGSLSLAEARERMSRTVRFLDEESRDMWLHELESELMGSNGMALTRRHLRR